MGQYIMPQPELLRSLAAEDYWPRMLKPKATDPQSVLAEAAGSIAFIEELLLELDRDS